MRERERRKKKCFSVRTKRSRVTSRERNSRRDDVCSTNLRLGKEGNVPGGMPWNVEWESNVEPGYTSIRISFGLVPDFEPW